MSDEDRKLGKKVPVERCCKQPENLRWLETEGKATKFCRVCGRRFHRADFGQFGGVIILAEYPWPLKGIWPWGGGAAPQRVGIRWE